MRPALACLVCLLASVSSAADSSDPHLLALFTFNDATPKPADASGRKTKAKLFGKAAYGRGVEGQSICLLGEAFLELANPNAFVRDTQALTIAFWMKPTELPKNTRLVQKGAHESEWRLYINEEGLLTFWLHNKSAGAVRRAAPAAGQWVHVTASYSDLELRLYLNGKRVETRATGQERVAFSREPILLGAGWDRGRNPVESYRGFIDDFRFYSRALTDAEVATLATR